jgi:hypothetical protein
MPTPGSLGRWRQEYRPHDWMRRLEQAPAVATESIIPTRCVATAGDARRAVALGRTAAGVSENLPEVARSEAGDDGRLQSRGRGTGVTKHGATVEGRTRRLCLQLADHANYLTVFGEPSALQLGEDQTIVGHDLEGAGPAAGQDRLEPE